MSSDALPRIAAEPREGWQRKLDALGIHRPSEGSTVGWNEKCFYRITRSQAVAISEAARRAYELCLEAVAHVVAEDRFYELGIPPHLVPIILRSWNERHPTLLTRFDFDYDGKGPPKLLGISADIPRGVRFAGPAQWQWKEESFAEGTQYNEIYELVLAAFKGSRIADRHWVFTAQHKDDRATSRFLYRIALEAGISAEYVELSQITRDDAQGAFLSPAGKRIDVLYKGYRWVDLLNDPFGAHVVDGDVLVFEPAWSLVLESKAFLALLWELFPGNPLLTPAWLGKPAEGEWRAVPAYEYLGAPGSKLRLEDQTVYLPPQRLHNGVRRELHCWMVYSRDAGIAFCEHDGARPVMIPHLMTE